MLLTTILASSALLLSSNAPLRTGRRVGRAPMMSGSSSLPTVDDLTDEREWLEEVEGEKPLEWVMERNKHAVGTIGEPSDKPTYGRIKDMWAKAARRPHDLRCPPQRLWRGWTWNHTESHA